MSRLERALERLTTAIERVEGVAAALRDREHAIRTEAAETVGAALAELRRAAAEAPAEADDGKGGDADG